MQYLILAGTNVYVPESPQESDLVRHVLQARLDLVTHEKHHLWEDDEKREGPWYKISMFLPGGLHPLVVEVALPINIQEELGLVCRIWERTPRELVERMIQMLNDWVYGTDLKPFTAQHFQDALVLEYWRRIWRAYRTENAIRRMPRHVLRAAQGRAVPLVAPSVPENVVSEVEAEDPEQEAMQILAENPPNPDGKPVTQMTRRERRSLRKRRRAGK